MRDIQEIGEQANRARVHLLFVDAQMALTMLDLADLSQVEELRHRRINTALKAYSYIRDCLPNVSLTPAEDSALNKRMAELKLRLSFS